jgi:hypothetical protein
MNVFLDYFPMDMAWAAQVASQLEASGNDVFLPHRDAPHDQGPDYPLMKAAAATSERVVLLWSRSGGEYASGNEHYTRNAAKRLMDSGLDKIIVLREPGARMPLVLEGLNRVQSFDDLTRELAGAQKESAAASIPGSDYFVSYSSQDHGCAVAVVDTLSSLGSVWFAPKSMKGNLLYGTEILRAIRNVQRKVVLLLTPHSEASGDCLREMYIAMQHDRPIVVLQCPGVTLRDDWGYPLANVHRADLSCVAPSRDVILRVAQAQPY